MVIDSHVHVAAMSPPHGFTSPRLSKSLAFRFMRWRLGLVGNDQNTERQIEAKLTETLDGTPELDAVVVLAFDAVFDVHGEEIKTAHEGARMKKRIASGIYSCSFVPLRGQYSFARMAT